MRYCVSAKVEGNIYLKEPGVIEHEDFLIDLRTNSSNLLTEIAISIKVPDDKLSSMKSTAEPSNGNVAAKFNIGGDQELFNRLIRELQYIESDISFATVGTLHRVYWENPSNIEFIPETDDDFEFPVISLHGLNKSYRKTHAVLSMEDITSLLNESSTTLRLRVAKAFWRDGLTYFNQFKYIQAFYSFYFVIEDYYAGGKSNEKQVLKQFNKSPEFKEISELSLKSISREKRHKDNLNELFKDEGLEMDQTGLATFLFRVRGKLHHYSSKSSKKQGTPFNQMDFESVALLVLHMATVCIQTNDPGLRNKRLKPLGVRPT